MENVIILLTVVVALLLAVVVLVQNPKGGGLNGGIQATQIGGVQQTADFMEKATWYLVIGMFVLCILSASFSATSRYDEEGSSIEQPTEEAPQQ
jgi:preprotein translocase subunit SecG